MLIEGFLIAFVVGIGSVFLLMALALLKGVLGHLWERWGSFFAALASREWAATIGKVERAAITYATTGRGGRIYTPLVRYSYGVNGESFVSDRFAFYVANGSLEDIQGVVRRYRPGSSVEVYYDPNQPKRATLDRGVPPVVGPTFGWLFLLLLAGSLFSYLGVIIVRGAFEDPPNLGEVPPLIAQIGGFAGIIGAILVLVAGVRAIRWEERRQRRLLRTLEAAKPALVGEVRAGEIVAVSGRAEELDAEPEDEDGAPAGPGELPFEEGAFVYYDVDAEWFRRTFLSDFVVRDSSGIALVEVGEPESTFTRSQRLPIEGAVERFLDDQREDITVPVAAVPTQVRFDCIKKDDAIVVVGRVERDDDEFVFRATPGDPTSLLVATGSREEVIERLGRRVRRTRALLLLGVGLIVAGLVAALV